MCWDVLLQWKISSSHFFGMKNLNEKKTKNIARCEWKETNRFDPTSLLPDDDDEAGGEGVCFAASIFIGSFEGVIFSPLSEFVFDDVCPWNREIPAATL